MNTVSGARRAVMFIVVIIIMGRGAWCAVGPQVPVNPTFGSAPGNQDYVSIAASPNGYFAVWQDTRGTNGADIYGCRISVTGQVLELTGIAICTLPTDQITPAVAWDGQQYIVAWADRRGTAQHVYASRVSTSGVVLDPQGILVSGTTGTQNNPRLSGDGSGCLVVWQDSRGSSPDIYGAKISSNGTLGMSYGISTRGDNEEMPDVSFNGTMHLVVWRDYRNMVSTDTDIYGVRVAKSGLRSGTEVMISNAASGTAGAAASQRYPRVCSFSGSWMVAWEDLRNDTLHPDIYGTRVSSSGIVQDKGGIAICNLTGDQEFPSVTFNGSKILVSWRNGSDRRVRAARLSTNGALYDVNGISISAGAVGSSGNAVVGINNSFMACWSTLSATSSDAMASPVTDTGLAQSPSGSMLSYALNNQQDYVAIDNGNEYAVVWSALVNGSRDILGARVLKSGTILTTTPINLTTGIAGDQTQPAIAWNGSKYLLVWRGTEAFSTSDYDIRGRFLDANMTPIGTTAATICLASEEQSRPVITSNKTNFLVVWQDSRNAISPSYYNDLYGALVSSSGVVTTMITPVSLATGNQNLPAVASDGSNYMVVWEDYRGASPLIKATRVTSSGQVQDTNGIAFPATSSSQTFPSICYGSGCYFVAWSDYTKISACRVNTSGVLIDAAGITVNSGTKRKQTPNVCWDGQKYQVVWEDYGSSDSANGDIYGNTVNTSGVAASYPATALISNLIPQVRPSIMASGGFGVLFYMDFSNYTNGIYCAALEETGVQEVASISEAKQMPSGSMIALSDKVVSGSFPGYFYMQEPNRLGGIRVVSSGAAAVGNLVDVVGTLSVVDGERQINAASIVARMDAFAGLPKPLGIRGDFLGGGPLNDQTPGITGMQGVNNIGLLVTTWGKVIYSGAGYFYIESSPSIAIMVKSGNLTQPAVGRFVTITGVSTCELVSGGLFRAILPRIQSDIVTIR